MKSPSNVPTLTQDVLFIFSSLANLRGKLESTALPVQFSRDKTCFLQAKHNKQVSHYELRHECKPRLT